MTSCSKTCVGTQNATSSVLVRTESVVTTLRKMPDGWGGVPTSKKPGTKTLRKMRKILAVLESSHLPWPEITVVPNGCVLLIWHSLTRDMQMNVDADGDVQFITSLKNVDMKTGEILDQLDSEGHVIDMLTIDHMMAWYCSTGSAVA